MHVFDGVLASFPGHVQKTLPMELKTEVGTARVAWLNPVSKESEKLLRKSARVQNKVPVCSRIRRKLVHPERGIGRFVLVPGHPRRVEEIEVPCRGLKSQSLRVQIPDLTPRVPDMDHR